MNMLSSYRFRVAGAVVVACVMLLSTALAGNLVPSRESDQVVHPKSVPGRHVLDTDWTQLRYVKTTDFGVTWTPLTQAGDISALAADSTQVGDFSAIVTNGNELCYALYMAGPPAGIYAVPGPTFVPVLAIPEGAHNFHDVAGEVPGSGLWADIGKTPNGDLFIITWSLVIAGTDTTEAAFIGAKSTDNGATWGNSFVIAAAPAIPKSAEYPHISQMNTADRCHMVFQDATFHQYAIWFPTAGAAGTVVDLGAGTGSNVSYYIGSCTPIACDPDATPPEVYICWRGIGTGTGGAAVYHSENNGSTYSGSQATTFATRYPSVAMRHADLTPFVVSNLGVPAGEYTHKAWFAYDGNGYNGGGWTVPDTSWAIAPAPYVNPRPLFYVNQQYWWDGTHGVGSNNLWGARTPEGLYSEYTSNGGTTWSTPAQRWEYHADGINAATTANCELVGGSNGVAYIITAAALGITDTIPPEMQVMSVSNPTTAGPFVVSAFITDPLGIINVSSATANAPLIIWWNNKVDAGAISYVEFDSAHYGAGGFAVGNGVYFFTLPDTNHDGTHFATGDTVRFVIEAGDGNLNYGDTFENWIIIGTGWLGTSDPIVPVAGKFELRGNYPNPFNPTTSIIFNLPADYRVTLKVFNTLGQEVSTLADNALMNRGDHTIAFDASRLPSGVYFYALSAGPYSAARKMVLLK
jgi:hypothetical protein